MLFSFFAKSTMYWTCSFVRIKWQLQLPPYKGAIHFKGIHETLSRPGLSISLIPWNRLSRRTAKPNKMTCQVKTQINLGIHPVWSELAVRTKKPWVRGYPLSAAPKLICVFAVRTYHLFILSCSGWIALFPKIKIVIAYVPCSPKLSLCLCSPHFHTLVPLFPWNKCLYSRVP